MSPSPHPAVYSIILRFVFTIFMFCSALVSANDNNLTVDKAGNVSSLDAILNGDVHHQGANDDFADGGLSGLSAPVQAGLVGVTYKAATPGIPPPEQVVKAIIRYRIPRVRLIDPDIEAISAFVGTGIDLNLSLENLGVLKLMAGNVSAAQKWLNDTVVPFKDRVKISSISIGYGVLTRHLDLAHLMVPAVKNAYAACNNLGLNSISISSGHSFDLMDIMFPPCVSIFNETYVPYLKELLAVDAAHNGAFQIDLYPFHIFRQKVIPGVTSTFVMFEAREDQYLHDTVIGLAYRNLYDVMVDAVVGALARLGYPYIPILVIGTGWPSDGDRDEAPEASLLYAAEYNERLVSRLNMYPGTPLRPSVTPVTFLYGLFDDEVDELNLKSFENKWGILNKDLSDKYHIDFSVGKGNTQTGLIGGSSSASSAEMRKVPADRTRWMPLLSLWVVANFLGV